MAEPYLTMAEIEKRYPQEWVLVNQLQKRHDGFAIGGVVVAHGTNKEAILGEMDKLPIPRNVAFFYTGPIPDDVLFLL